jgi:hypothetical protein
MRIAADIGGVQARGTIVENGDHPNVYEAIVLAAGKAASAWVRTDADTAACNLAEGHGYTSGKCVVFWTGGRRYDVDAVVSGNALTLDAGVGDDYPDSANTTVVVCRVQWIRTAIDGDAVQLLILDSTVRASLLFLNSGGAAVKHRDLNADNPNVYAQSSGRASPLTGDPIVDCYAANGTTLDGILTILSLEDSTP